MMQCSTVDARLEAYLRGLLSESEATDLELHAAGCTRCGPLVEERSRLNHVLPRESTPAPHHRERVLAHVAAHRPPRQMRWWVPATIAAGLLLAVGLMRPPVKSGQRPATPGLPAAMAAERADGEFQQLDAARAELREAMLKSPGDPMLVRALERLDAQRKSMERLIREFET